MSESVVQTMEKAINRSSAELRKETIITGCALVTSFFRCARLIKCTCVGVAKLQLKKNFQATKLGAVVSWNRVENPS